MGRKYQVCKRCVMDTSDPHIYFDYKGICNHCKQWHITRSYYTKNKAKFLSQLNDKIELLKQSGSGKYDCLVGISGGVDSTYMIYVLKEIYGLNPLAFHLDNGWNSIEATRNIVNIVRRLGVDLYTHVINWEEFKKLQQDFFKSSVIDVELLTDHAIKAASINVAIKYGIKYIVTGSNPYTESIMPKSWTFSKHDATNIRDIIKKHSDTKLKTFPYILLKDEQKLRKQGMIDYINFYTYYDLDLSHAMATIKDKLMWKEYGGKHYESVFTKIYQSYYLPIKFNVDKRKAHYSTLICLNQLTRDEALLKLESKPYDPETIQRDIDYLCKKLGFSNQSFEKIMNAKPVSHFKYKTNFRSKIQKKIMIPTNPLARFYWKTKKS